MTAGFVAGARARVTNVRQPPPPIAHYESWFAEEASLYPALNKRFTAIDAKLLRRVVIMRRDGYNFSEIAEGLGHTPSGIRYAWSRLPEALR